MEAFNVIGWWGRELRTLTFRYGLCNPGLEPGHAQEAGRRTTTTTSGSVQYLKAEDSAGKPSVMTSHPS